jgi:hypothetical protein
MSPRSVTAKSLAAFAGAAMLTLSVGPVSAFTFSGPSLEQSVASAQVDKVWWRGGGWRGGGWRGGWRGGWHRGWGWRGYGWGPAAVAGGLAAGAIIAGQGYYGGGYYGGGYGYGYGPGPQLCGRDYCN